MGYFALLAGVRTVGRMLPLLLSRCVAHTRRFTAGTLCTLVGIVFLMLITALALLTLLALLLRLASLEPRRERRDWASLFFWEADFFCSCEASPLLADWPSALDEPLRLRRRRGLR